jgi:hypothetical protein
MKKLSLSLLCLLILLLDAEAAFSCTCSINFRKNFRRAGSVFLGKIVEVNKGAGTDNYYNDIVRLDVEKTWKGAKRKTVTVQVGPPNRKTGMCGSFGFEKDIRYVVFAFTDRLQVNTECSATFAIEQDSEWQAKRLKDLDNFWYRSWSRVYSF